MEFIIFIIVVLLVVLFNTPSRPSRHLYRHHKPLKETKLRDFLDEIGVDYSKIPTTARTSSISSFFADKDSTPPRYCNQFMTAIEKRDYLCSPEWGQIRTRRFMRDKYTCQSCGSTNLLNCHHITYERLGDEDLVDLITLCQTCHTTLHEQLGYDRITKYPIS